MASQGGVSFIWFVAMLSTAVGLMNLFPIPVLDGAMRLGTWQGIWLAEHRRAPYRREVALHLIGT